MKKYSLMILSCVVSLGFQVDAMSVRERAAQLNAAVQQPGAARPLAKRQTGRLSDARLARFEGTAIPTKTQAPPAVATSSFGSSKTSGKLQSSELKHLELAHKLTSQHQSQLEPAIYTLSLPALELYAQMYQVALSMVSSGQLDGDFFMMLLEFAQEGHFRTVSSEHLMKVFGSNRSTAIMASEFFNMMHSISDTDARIILHILASEFGLLDNGYANTIAMNSKKNV